MLLCFHNLLEVCWDSATPHTKMVEPWSSPILGIAWGNKTHVHQMASPTSEKPRGYLTCPASADLKSLGDGFLETWGQDYLQHHEWTPLVQRFNTKSVQACQVLLREASTFQHSSEGKVQKQLPSPGNFQLSSTLAFSKRKEASCTEQRKVLKRLGYVSDWSTRFLGVGVVKLIFLVWVGWSCWLFGGIVDDWYWSVKRDKHSSSTLVWCSLFCFFFIRIPSLCF